MHWAILGNWLCAEQVGRDDNHGISETVTLLQGCCLPTTVPSEGSWLLESVSPSLARIT